MHGRQKKSIDGPKGGFPTSLCGFFVLALHPAPSRLKKSGALFFWGEWLQLQWLQWSPCPQLLEFL